jgi:hypothetical protein
MPNAAFVASARGRAIVERQRKLLEGAIERSRNHTADEDHEAALAVLTDMVKDSQHTLFRVALARSAKDV